MWTAFRIYFTRFAHAVNHAVAQPFSFALAATCILVWLLSGPLFQWNNTWQLFINTITTIITFLMVFLIHHAQHMQTVEATPAVWEVEVDMALPSRFIVDYTYTRPKGGTTRTRLETSVTQLRYPAKSETAVLAYLKQRHPGLEVTILNIIWQNSAGDTV